MPDIYDSLFPGDVGGHVIEADRLFDGEAVKTPTGIDVGYAGEKHSAPANSKLEEVGPEQVNRRIGNVARDSVTDDVQCVRILNPSRVEYLTIIQVGPVPVLLSAENEKRNAITITNQGGNPVSVGKDRGIILNGVNTVSIPAGAGRTLSNTGDVYVVGAQGATSTVDVVIELW